MSENFQRTHDAIVRAAYRGILQREPDPDAAALLKHEAYDPDQEATLAETLSRFISSAEFGTVYERHPSASFPQGTWARVEVDGLLVWVDLGDLGVSTPCVTGAFEPVETRFIRQTLKPGMTFVDVGANIGWFSLNAASLVGPEGRVFAFEPRSDTFSALRRSFVDNGFLERATLVNAAAGESPGEILIGWAPEARNPGGTWTLANAELRESFEAMGRTLQSTPVKVLDEVIGDSPVDLIKIDIEGAEPIALRGARRILATQRPLILSELNPIVLAEVSRMSPIQFVGEIERLGYVCRSLTDDGPGPRLDATDPGLDRRVTNVIFEPE